MSLVDLPKKTPDTPAGGYRSSEHVYVDADGNVCEATDPNVAELRYATGAPIPFEEAERQGLVEPAKPAPKKRTTARKRTTTKKEI